ncbi:hybrid sensor histidine kinase/response regulator [Haloarchaeobius salinus]|uniref:hybrid sensor histidine kinase/response regulator n=1 Tax=Haloarchaeobius salinus TaxID=1198298 RepID=UPI002109285B
MPSNTATQTVEVLLVEDDADDARHFQRLLSAARQVPETDRLAGFELAAHTDRLADALDRLTECEPDVVLLDLRLPDSDGLGTLEAVVSAAPDVPVVVVTGNTDTGLGPAAIRAGAQDYLGKASITAELLRRTLRYAIERHEREREQATTNRQLMLLNRIIRRDIRNDAGVIVGQSDELRGHVDQQGAMLVDGLLDTAQDVVGRIETVAAIVDALTAGPDVDREPIDVTAVLDREVARVRDRRAVDITVSRPGESTLTVGATPMLAAVFRQLLSNAVLHTDRETPRVEVSVDASPQAVTVVVADDGVGMPARVRDGLTDLEAESHDETGIGTGLFLVTVLLEQLDGEIEFADNQPRGTIATVTLQRP